MIPTARIVLGVVIALILAGDAAAYTQIDNAKYPSHWDKRIAALVTFVEDTRHLRFEHPVDVEFLTNAQYRKRTGTDEGELSDEDKEALETFEGQAHALGLVGQDVDLLKQLNTIGTDATLAYYDDGAQKMVIRGTDLTVGLKATIVHELTHALQDQAFGIDRDFENDGASSFFQGLVEGDAERVENAYVESLDEADQRAYDTEDDANIAGAKDALTDVPAALVQLFGAPYELGRPLTEMIVDQRGTKGLDKFFRVPADSDEGLINPFAALDNEHAQKVARPKLQAGERKTDDGQFGAVPWYVVLSSFVDARTALAAVDGWGGDSYVGYRKDKRSCIRIAFQGDAPADNSEMTNALNQWKTAFRENSVQVTTTANGVELDACEPKVVPTPRADAAGALELPVFRLVLLNLFSSNNVPRKLADCMTRHVIAIVPLEKLHSESEADAQQLSGIGQQVGRGCASGQLT